MKYLRILALLLLCLSLLAFTACGDDPSNECTSHVDANGDEKCDTCGATVPKPECTAHTDANADGNCDVCGAEVQKPECTEHKDENADGNCDVCGTEVAPTTLTLVEKATPKFKIVVPNGASSKVAKSIDELVKDLGNLGVTVETVEDKEATVTDCEVLIGDVLTRGEEYIVNKYIYGKEGYLVKSIGKKIVVVGGSEDSLETAIEVFKEEFLGITESSKRLTKAVIDVGKTSEVIQDDYRVKKLTLFGKDMKDFTIAADTSVKVVKSVAEKLQDTIYGETGYWFPIVSPSEADKSIKITLAERTGGLGYKATFTENCMDFYCEYSTSIQNEITDFFTKKIVLSSSEELDFTASDSYEKNVRDVTYKSYGAKGDGKTDDSEAIRAAHEYANQAGHTVLADYNAVYYMGKLGGTIYVKTDVDWRDAKFILDDSKILPSDSARGTQIFTIPNPGTINVGGIKAWYTEVSENGGLCADTFTKIPLDFGQSALLRISNSTHVNYIRYGVNENDGATQNEVILVDKDGNVDPTTPLMFDFDKVTSVSVYMIDVEPITIQGGTFITYPYLAKTPQKYSSYGRGLQCSRSNVTFKNVKHYIENEGQYNYNTNTGDYGCPYGGFYNTSFCNNVVFENCVTSAHVTYKGSNGAGMGTYDISPGHSTNIVFKGCYQEHNNFFNIKEDGTADMSRWGIMGSSYCKNVYFIDSQLSRFDAHNGVHNVYLINSELRMIRVDGTGTFYMDNCIVHSSTLVGLREDYGGFWEGNVILKDVKMISSASTVKLFTNTWYNHNFGYRAAFPTNIIIDNLNVYTNTGMTNRSEATINLFDPGILTGATNSVQDYITVPASYSDGTQKFVANKNQVPPPERVIIRNCENTNITLPDVHTYDWFKDTVFSVNEETECTNHLDLDKDLICDDCKGEFTPCTEHSDINHDGICTWCGKDIEIPCDGHVDKDRTGDCDICHKDFVCPGHGDTNKDHICDSCAAPLCNGEHYTAKKDCICDICNEAIPCVDKNADGKCDECEKDA